MPPKDLLDTDEKKREALRRDLKAVGENLPDDPVDTEGADVRTVVRSDESEEARIARDLAEPHANAETELVRDLDLDEEDAPERGD